jgi:hypothetical protein
MRFSRRSITTDLLVVARVTMPSPDVLVDGHGECE